MNRSKDATPVNIPAEIVELILDNFEADLDAASLLSLGRVDHLFNHLALTRLIGPSVLNDIFLRSSLLFHENTPIYLAEALSIALWIPNVATIKYSASRHDIYHFVSDIRGLSLLLGRMSFGSLNELELDASIWFSSMSYCFGVDMQHALAWESSVAKLVDTALAAGCRRLSIISHGNYPIFYRPIPLPSPAQPPRRLGFSRLRRLFTRFNLTGKSRLNPIPTPYLKTTSSNLNVQIESLSLASGRLFISAFRDSTLRLLGRTSKTLLHLTLLAKQTPPEYIYGVLEEPVHFPQLKTLTLETPPGAPVSVKRLHAFLSDHPTITCLKLDIYVPEAFRRSFITSPPPNESSLLPNLEVLETSIQPLIWLLSLRKNLAPVCIHGSIKGSHAPVLKEIRLYADISELDDLSLGEALILINDFIPLPTQGSALSSSRLSLTLRTSRLSDWHSWGFDSTLHRQHERSAASRITHLTLELGQGSNIRVSKVLGWLAIKFPRLLELVILGRSFKGRVSSGMLCRVIFEKCQRLRKLQFNDEVVALRR